MSTLSGVIFDQWGQPFSRPTPEQLAPEQPTALQVSDMLARHRHRATVRDRQAISSALSNIKPETLLSIFSGADAGLVGQQVELAQDIEERDPHVSSLMENLRERVAGLEWKIAPGDDEPGSIDVMELFEEWWEELTPCETLIHPLMDAVLGQYAVHEVQWETRVELNGAPYWYPIATCEVDARRLQFPLSDTDGRSPWVPGLICNWDPHQVEPLIPGRHIVHTFRTRHGRPGKGALVRAIAAAWLIKYYATIDFANLVEKWGRPFPVVKHPLGATDAEMIALATSLAKSMADGAIVIPENASAEITSATAHITSLPQQALIKQCEEWQSKVLLGNTTQTDAAANNDSVSSPTHESGTDQIVRGHAKRIATTLRRDLIKPWFEWNRNHFDADACAPIVYPVLEKEEAPKDFAGVIAQIAPVGLQVKADELYRKLGLSRPDNVPDVIELRSTPVQSNPFGFGPQIPGNREQPTGGREQGAGDGQQPADAGPEKAGQEAADATEE